MPTLGLLHDALDSHEAVLASVREQLQSISEAANVLSATIHRNGRIFIAGNGGSHSLAEHLCAELVGRLDFDARPIGAFVLQNCTPVISALSNDHAFETALARELDALSRPGDAFLAISASGESRNLVAAADRAAGRSLTTVCLVGRRTSSLGDRCQIQLATPSHSVASVQQVHLVVVHLLWLALEQVLGTTRDSVTTAGNTTPSRR